MFAYPRQLTSDESEITVTTVPTREAWLPQVERLVAAYRAIGVDAAEILARAALADDAQTRIRPQTSHRIGES